MAEKSVKLSTTSFRDVPLCELSLEEALKAGAAKSEKLKPEDFHETSVRFCVTGLRGWLITYADEHYNNAHRNLMRDLSWQWASYCETNADILGVRTSLMELRHELSETNCANLMDQLPATLWRIKEFGYSGRPTVIRLPNAASGSIARSAADLGISFGKFLQVGWAWSLSTNGKGLYSAWINGTVTPLLEELTRHVKRRLGELDDIRLSMSRRLAEGAE